MSDASPCPVPPRCRWLQYGLRTMFAVVTAFAVFLGWLSWEWQFVRHRKVLLGQIEASGAIVFIGDVVYRHSPKIKEVIHGDNAVEISRLRQGFGDRPVTLIGFQRKLTDADREAVKAFPEADIYAIP